MLPQQLVPGVVGISTFVDSIYLHEIQSTAVALRGSAGPINQLRMVMATLDFNELVEHLMASRFEAAENQVAEAVARLEKAGADFVLVTSGTTSTLTGQARRATSISFLDMAEAVWSEAGEARNVGLLSTRRTAASGMFQAAADRKGARLLTPDGDLAAQVDDAIFGDLIRGAVSDGAVDVLLRAIVGLAADGAEVVILGNTDMALAVDRLRPTVPVPLVDGARAHARAAAKAALDGVIRNPRTGHS